MILIKCCELCKHYDAEQMLCKSRDSWNTGVTPEDWCPEWEGMEVEHDPD